MRKNDKRSSFQPNLKGYKSAGKGRASFVKSSPATKLLEIRAFRCSTIGFKEPDLARLF